MISGEIEVIDDSRGRGQKLINSPRFAYCQKRNLMTTRNMVNIFNGVIYLLLMFIVFVDDFSVEVLVIFSLLLF